MFRFGKMHEMKKEMSVKPWLGMMEPCRIAGGVYFVGTYQASSHIIDTGDGLIMIDTGYSATAYLVLNSIYKLGFRPEDIKYIINTHWHGDHTEATEAFARLSGAKTLIGKYDAEKASKYFTPDILINDGDELTLGNTTVHFVHTPGHTQGTVSFFFDVCENGETLRVGSFGGAGLNTMVPSAFDFEGCREAYFNSLKRLMKEKVDVFIGNHTWNNNTYGKIEKILAGGENEFIDREIWQKFMLEYEARLTALIEREQEG